MAVVVGANDVVNPAAKNSKGSPIYGMPIFNVDRRQGGARAQALDESGFAGIDNELFGFRKR